MILSTRYRFIFLHINRTGGGSISETLRPFGTHPAHSYWTRFLTRYGLIRNLERANFPPHITARMIEKRFPRGLFETYLSAAFVRNPYSWIVALYNAIQLSKGHRYQSRVARMSGFPEYVDWEIRRNKRSISRFVTDMEGRLMVDFIGRFENLHLDFKRFCQVVGLNSLELLHAKTRRPHADYRTYYNDETREKVAHHWKRDIEGFGYDFDGLIDPHRLPPRRRAPKAELLSNGVLISEPTAQND
jgi:hypothetical protein